MKVGSKKHLSLDLGLLQNTQVNEEASVENYKINKVFGVGIGGRKGPTGVTAHVHFKSQQRQYYLYTLVFV